MSPSLGLVHLPMRGEDIDGVSSRRRLDVLTFSGESHLLTVDQAVCRVEGRALVLRWARVFSPLGEEPRRGVVVLIDDVSGVPAGVLSCLRTLIYDDLTYGSAQLRLDELLEQAAGEVAA